MNPQYKMVATSILIGLAVGLSVAISVILLLWCYRRHRKQKHLNAEHKASSLPIHMNEIDSRGILGSGRKGRQSPQILREIKHPRWQNHDKNTIPSGSGIPRYSYKDVEKATENFTKVLGQGSFGPVYKAKMPTGEVVAIKVLASDSSQGEKEFKTEVILLSRLHHRCLVNLVGYCVDKGQHMLIYQFMSNGSLADHLYNEGSKNLSWDERIQIALDVSHGIEYLHEGAIPSVIHRDLKSANILLDQTMRAKVADFGLSKEEVGFDRRKSCVKGTLGYIDPEYTSTNRFTKKSDIYSFGVIMFELITAIHPQQGLMDYIELAAMNSDDPNRWEEILDKQLIGQCDPTGVRLFASIAFRCIHILPRKRPSIVDVSQVLGGLRQRRLCKSDSLCLARGDFSRVIKRMETQQIEMSHLPSIREKS